MSRDQFEGYQQGSFFRPNRYREDEGFNVDRGSGDQSIPYDMIEDGRPRPDDEHVWYVSNYASGSDYSGTLVGKSNYEVLKEEAERLSEEMGDDTWYQTFYGGHGTYAIAFHVDRTPEEIIRMLNGLEDYPLIDESKHSEMEMEAQDEAWKLSTADDYRRALEQKFGGDADTVDDDVLFEHFQEAREAANEEWVNEQGDQAYINVEKVVEGADEPPTGMKLYYDVTFYTTDSNDWSETEHWYVLATSAERARAIFREAVKGGDPGVWGVFDREFSESPESSGDDTYYIATVDLEDDEDGEGESDVYMIGIGSAEQVDEEDHDEERLLEESGQFISNRRRTG